MGVTKQIWPPCRHFLNRHIYNIIERVIAKIERRKTERERGSKQASKERILSRNPEVIVSQLVRLQTFPSRAGAGVQLGAGHHFAALANHAVPNGGYTWINDTASPCPGCG